MPRTLPNRPNLDQLKRQAKELLKAYRSGDRDARQLFERQLGSAIFRAIEEPGARRPVLADALTVLAREYGFASWPKLKQHVESLAVETPVPSASAERAARKLARKLARQQWIADTAEQLVSAAADLDLRRLFAGLCIGRYDGDAVRAYLVAQNGYTTIVDALLLAAEHPQPRVRFLAAQAMDHFADERCAEVLRRLVRDAVPRVRWAAIHSLGCDLCKLAPLPRDGDFVLTLIELALHDPSVRVRREAGYELGQACQDERTVAALQALAATSADPIIVRNVRWALEQRRSGSA
jgi:hypothetical protein